jgi:hypothetical protein
MMTNATKQAEEIAALKKKVEELEAKVDPPKSTFVPVSDAEWRDRMHQMREGRMAMATPPSALQDMVAAEPKGFMRDVAMRDGRAPNTPGMVPSSQQPSGSGGAAPSRGSGWVDAAPIGPPPGLRYVDAQLDAQDAKDLRERKRMLGEK